MDNTISGRQNVPREIVYYRTSGGKLPVMDFIDSLPRTEQAKVARLLDLLERYGIQLGMPYVKNFSGGVLELRVRGGRARQEIRIFLTTDKTASIIYLLHAFVKQTQKTPKKEIIIAKTRQKQLHNL